jgi:hypothetical protein
MSSTRPLIVAVIAVGALAFVACGGSQAGSGVGPPQLDPDLPRVGTVGAEDGACSMDQECVLVQDCCGCSGGGRLFAVRQDRVEALQGAAESQCSDRCAATAERHRSCSSSEAVCRGGRCIPRLQ